VSALPGWFGREPALGLLEALESLARAASDPRVDGVLLRFRAGSPGWSRVDSLVRAVRELRAAGKPVVAYAETLDAPALLLASSATEIWLPESGSVHLIGLRAEGFFLRGLLERLDVRPEVVRIGDYKSAGELLTRQQMSPEGREQVEHLIDDWFESLVSGLASGRRLDAATVRDLIDRGPFHARAAREAGLIDGCCYPDELEVELQRLAVGEGAAPDTRPIHLVDGVVYHALRAQHPVRQSLLSETPRIAYRVASGGIHRGRGHRGIGSEGFGQQLEALRANTSIRGVVLRIDSPGGDAAASDLLWRAVTRLAEEKPVVASLGDVAASGGYFLAAASGHVLAEPGTVTGSIGVVGGKVNLEGFYERIGVAKDAVERGARAGMLSESRGFTPDERSAVREEMEALYEIFLDRVSSGRGLAREAVARAASGRVWSGRRARRLGLIDGFGGPLEAIRVARIRAGLDSDDPFVLDRPPRMPPWARLTSVGRWLSAAPGSVSRSVW
jgi:protease-4